ncbi:probable inactive 1-aminocyclopropane-1-carboxylate synthase-like protein 2 [Suncus etruscus]|uniref:probable inactive 1-aminocyclopropane-1-carboxylate synthase-like protein 2 n=1 Tax=Suncus etruscus TaxID=109475 RepID=UPI002110A704|nr:probable inactive 1-aminocyclopropane-1-carboxylate synthase-like protein 2 [Suncus etruscus]
MSLPADDPGMARGRELRTRSLYAQLLHSLLQLNGTMKDLIWLLITKHQDPVPSGQVTKLKHLMYSSTNLLQLRSSSLPPHSLGSQGNVRTHAQDSLMIPLDSMQAAFVSPELSNRGIDITTLCSFSFQDFLSYQADKYQKEKNSLGFINLGISENTLCSHLVTERMSQKGITGTEDVLMENSDQRKILPLREAIAQFLTHYCKAPTELDQKNVVVLNGCCAVFSALAMVLCDPGDAILIPTPSYGAFTLAAKLYTRIELIFVHLSSEVSEENPVPFQLTVNKLEEALLEARLKGKKVKGFVLINPQYPLGNVYSQESMEAYLEFAKRNKLHVIVDERNMLSVFDKSIKFHSILSFRRLPDPSRTHVIWSTSKEFGIPDLCFGALYTHNQDVAAAVGSLAFLHGISSITQNKLSQLLMDKEWITQVYLPTSHAQLQTAYKYAITTLRKRNIPFLYCGSGFSIWINLQKYLDPCTFNQEQCLHNRFLDHKVLLSQGKACLSPKPGWFCLVFAKERLELELGLDRFIKALNIQQYENIKRQLEDAMIE